MIPGQFDYHRPKSVGDAVKLLGKLKDSRAIAGGHSLIPMMKLRLAAPTALVDLADIRELKGIKVQKSKVIIGAMTTQQEIIASEALAKALPIIRETSLVIADPQVRNLGTIGGNVANGDPGNDMPALMMCLNATYVVSGPRKSRSVRACDYYQGSFVTALKPGEILTHIEISLPPDGHGYAYEKLKRKVGDYATAAAAVMLTMNNGKVATCSIGLTNLGDTPLFAEKAASVVVGTSLDATALKAAAAEAEAIMQPASDTRGPAEYRKKVGGVMVIRALQKAASRSNT
jgi:carbon-monoxide dehydrogenase medium subunit